MAKRAFSMSDNEIKQRRKLYKEEPDLVVNRQPESRFSALPIIVAIFAIYILFNLLSKDNSIIESLSESVISGVEIPETQNSNKQSNANLLHQIVSNGNVEELEQQLLSDRDTINDVVNGMTPIMLAATRGNVEMIDLLFTQGADPNKRGSMQRTALQYATEKNHIEACKRLLNYGADIDAYDNGRLSPLIMAANRGHTALALLFIERGADVNIQHVNGWTALIDATARGDEKLVNALLNAGANKNLAEKNGKTAIDYAKEYGFKNIEKILGK